MKLHENKELLRQAIIETSADLNIPREFIEKDYWICQILQRLSRHDKSELTRSEERRVGKECRL